MSRALALKILSLLSLLMFLTSCGWNLRGLNSYQGPTVIYLVAEERFSPLSLAMREAMRLGSVSDEAEARLQLHLGREELVKRVVAVTSIGSPAQYEMSLSARFRYQVPGDPEVTLPQTLSVQRAFDFDPSSTVAKREEENTLLDEMRRELAQRILQQARYLASSQTPTHGNSQQNGQTQP
jgi:LPS-assembly lipoprotein